MSRPAPCRACCRRRQSLVGLWIKCFWDMAERQYPLFAVDRKKPVQGRNDANDPERKSRPDDAVTLAEFGGCSRAWRTRLRRLPILAALAYCALDRWITV